MHALHDASVATACRHWPLHHADERVTLHHDSDAPGDSPTRHGRFAIAFALQTTQQPKGATMRIGIVVDSACDLPQDFIQRNNVIVLPISVRIGEAVLADHRDEEATLSFLHAHVAERGHEAETTPFSVNQIRDLFLQRLVIDYDHVFCLTISKLRSQIFDNAMQASFAILNDYKPIRQAAGHTSPFALRVIDTLNLFAGQGITAVEAVRLREQGQGVAAIRARLEQLSEHTYGYMIPRDLYYLRARARTKGDRSVGLISRVGQCAGYQAGAARVSRRH
ncbi:hypothetical protein SM17710_21225 [Xanthomonas hortorum pv. gardneri]|nr:hypothetical protein SM17710_21225 [Xanthomonas hortorum pv. gardneri]